MTDNARLALCSLGIEVQKLNLKQKFNMNKNVQVSNSAQIAQNQLLCEGLNSSAQIIFQNNKAKGFWDNERNVGELLMLVTSELGEAMEAHRKGNFTPDLFKGSSHTPSAFKEHIKDTFEDEIADAVIRLLDLSAGLGIDLEWHIRSKVQYNESRQKLHGKLY